MAVKQYHIFLRSEIISLIALWIDKQRFIFNDPVPANQSQRFMSSKGSLETKTHQINQRWLLIIDLIWESFLLFSMLELLFIISNCMEYDPA